MNLLAQKNTRFTLFFSLGMLSIFFIKILLHHKPHYTLLALIFTVVLLRVARPTWSNYLVTSIEIFFKKIQFTINTILLIFIFVFLFMPISFFMKIRKSDPLKLKIDPEKDSYFTETTSLITKENIKDLF